MSPFLKSIIIFIILMIVFYTVIVLIVRLPIAKKRKQLKRYEDVFIGMPEDVMLEIMGKKYNKSSLKNNTFKYEWRMNNTRYGYNGRLVRKVDIYVSDGKVTEIRPFNV